MSSFKDGERRYLWLSMRLSVHVAPRPCHAWVAANLARVQRHGLKAASRSMSATADVWRNGIRAQHVCVFAGRGSDGRCFGSVVRLDFEQM